MNIFEKMQNGSVLSDAEKKRVCNDLLTSEENMENLILSCFDERDYLDVYEHRIGGGVIGGKACGMLAAHALIKKNMPESAERIIPHNSYYLGTQVFVSFLKTNDCMNIQEKVFTADKNAETYQSIMKGVFPPEIRKEMLKALDTFDGAPVIVRSSSMFEDGYENAFIGKYESVFCMNQGSDEQRLEELERAVKTVYASASQPSVLEYRRKRGLADMEDQMAVLIQRVEGRFFGPYYFPAAAGMGCSYNTYKWMEALNPDAGMLRVVAGLGTRAVQRMQSDYPRMIGLERPEAVLYRSVAERHRYSQRQVDVLETAGKKKITVPLDEIIPLLPEKYKKMLLSRDDEAEQRLMQRGQFRKVYFADCEGVAKKRDFMAMMARLLKMLEREFGRPVDVEYALDVDDNGMIKINLFQCRPLRRGNENAVKMGDIEPDKVLFDVGTASVHDSKSEQIDVIVWISPQKYYECRYSKKAEVAYAVGRINHYYENSDSRLMLLAPGRIGTSSPELGVPVSYADVNNFSAICEVEYSKAGYMPELSYGSHMFQDLVEGDIFYGAIQEGGATRCYHPDLLNRFPNIFLKLFPELERFEGVIKVYDMREAQMRLFTDMQSGRAICTVDLKK